MCGNSKCVIWQLLTIFFWWLVLACNAFYFNKPYNCIAHITFYTQRKRLLLTIMHCSLYTTNSFVLGRSALLQPKWSLVLRCLPLPHALYTSMYLQVVAVLHYNNHDSAIHTCVLKACVSSKCSKCISAIKRVLSSTVMYISSSSFMYLCIACYCDACLKSIALRVGVKTLHNTFTKSCFSHQVQSD